YQIRLDATPVEDLTTRLTLSRRIARIYEEQLEDLEGAFVWYGKVFRLDPGDRAIRDQLSRLANVLEAWPRLADVYEEYLKEGEDENFRAEVLRLLAMVYELRMGNVDGAYRSYLRLYEMEPEEETFRALEALLTRAQRPSELDELYRDTIESTPDLE